MLQEMELTRDRLGGPAPKHSTSNIPRQKRRHTWAQGLEIEESKFQYPGLRRPGSRTPARILLTSFIDVNGLATNWRCRRCCGRCSAISGYAEINMIGRFGRIFAPDQGRK